MFDQVVLYLQDMTALHPSVAAYQWRYATLDRVRLLASF